jgi:hypothetical protein
MTNGEVLKTEANKLGIPQRTLEQVRATLARDKKRSKPGARIDVAMANLMLKTGRLTDEARVYVEKYLRTEKEEC